MVKPLLVLLSRILRLSVSRWSNKSTKNREVTLSNSSLWATWLLKIPVTILLPSIRPRCSPLLLQRKRSLRSMSISNTWKNLLSTQRRLWKARKRSQKRMKKTKRLQRKRRIRRKRRRPMFQLKKCSRKRILLNQWLPLWWLSKSLPRKKMSRWTQMMTKK